MDAAQLFRIMGFRETRGQGLWERALRHLSKGRALLSLRGHKSLVRGRKPFELVVRYLCLAGLLVLGPSRAVAFSGVYLGEPLNICQPDSDAFDWDSCYNFNFSVIRSSINALVLTGTVPTGAAGGSLSGTYPNPSIASLPAISGANLTNLTGGNVSGTVANATTAVTATNNVLKAGDTMTGALTLSGAGSYVVSGTSITTSGGFFGQSFMKDTLSGTNMDSEGLKIMAKGAMSFLIDTDGDDSALMLWEKNAATVAGGTEIMRLDQSGNLETQGAMTARGLTMPTAASYIVSGTSITTSGGFFGDGGGLAGLNATNITLGTLPVARLGSAAIDTTKLARGAVDTTILNNFSVTNAKIAALAVDTSKIAATGGSEGQAITIMGGVVGWGTVSSSGGGHTISTGALTSTGAVTGPLYNFPSQTKLAFDVAGFAAFNDTVAGVTTIRVNNAQVISSTSVYPNGTLSAPANFGVCFAGSTATWTQGSNAALVNFSGSATQGAGGSASLAFLIDGQFPAGLSRTKGISANSGSNSDASFHWLLPALSAGSHSICLTGMTNGNNLTVPGGTTVADVAQLSVFELNTGGAGYSAPMVATGTWTSTTFTAATMGPCVTGSTVPFTVGTAGYRMKFNFTGVTGLSAAGKTVFAPLVDGAFIDGMSSTKGITASNSNGVGTDGGSLNLPYITGTPLAAGAHNVCLTAAVLSGGGTLTVASDSNFTNQVTVEEMRVSAGTGDLSSNGNWTASGANAQTGPFSVGASSTSQRNIPLLIKAGGAAAMGAPCITLFQVGRSSQTPANTGTVKLMTYTLPANTLRTDDIIYVWAKATHTATSQAKKLNIKFGGTTISGADYTGTRTTGMSYGWVAKSGSSTQNWHGWNDPGSQGALEAAGTSSITDTADIEITVESASAAGILGDTTLTMAQVVYCPAP